MCGGVQFEIDRPLRPVINCHCHRCRPFSGHHVAATATAVDGCRLTEDSTLEWYEPATGVFYGFCGRCGSSLFFRTAAEPNRISIMAGTLRQPTGLETAEAWWVSEAGDYHQRPDGLVEYPEDG